MVVKIEDSLFFLPLLYKVILNLYKNFIEGPLPDVGKLKNLIKLDLSRNRFTGPIPIR